MNKILLGIYHTPTFDRVRQDSSLQTYPFQELITNWDHMMGCKVIDVVRMACNMADLIYFIIDDIKFPLDIKESYTCHELKHIMNNKKIFSKTIFIHEGREITDVEILVWWNANK